MCTYTGHKYFYLVELWELFKQLCFFWFIMFALRPIGKEQPGDWPELQAEDLAAATGAGTDWAQGDAGTAHWQIWVYWRGQISCHEWYAIPIPEHAVLTVFHSFCSIPFFFFSFFLVSYFVFFVSFFDFPSSYYLTSFHTIFLFMLFIFLFYYLVKLTCRGW